MDPVSTSAAVVPNLWLMILKTLAILCFVVGILIAFLFVIKRSLYQRGGSTAHGAIKLLTTYYISPKERLILFDVLGEKILIGVTSQNMNYITKVDSDVPIETPAESVKRDGGFKEALKSAIAKS